MLYNQSVLNQNLYNNLEDDKSLYDRSNIRLYSKPKPKISFKYLEFFGTGKEVYKQSLYGQNFHVKTEAKKELHDKTNIPLSLSKDTEISFKDNAELLLSLIIDDELTILNQSSVKFGEELFNRDRWFNGLSAYGGEWQRKMEGRQVID